MIMLAMSRPVTFSTPAETYFGRDTSIKASRSRTNRSVFFQNTVDDLRKGDQLLAFRWLAAAVARGFRMPEHLLHCLARNAKPTCRLALTQPISMARQPNT